MGDVAYVGDVRRPKIEVLDPDTDEPLELPEVPTVTIIAPDKSESPGTVTPEGEHWQVIYELTMEGPWRVVVVTPAPYKDVEVDDVYANPTRPG